MQHSMQKEKLRFHDLWQFNQMQMQMWQNVTCILRAGHARDLYFTCWAPHVPARSLAQLPV